MSGCDDILRPTLEQAFSDSVNIVSDGEDCKVTLPFERPNFDAITLWIIDVESGYIITDEGQTYGELYLSNVNIDSGKSKKKIQRIEERYELEKSKYEIRLSATSENLGDRILDATQAVESISHLVYKRRKYNPSDFKERVSDFLADSEFLHTQNVEIEGTTGPHIVDFQIENTDQPTLMETIHASSKTNAKNQADGTSIMWIELDEKYPNVRKISLYDDEEGVIDDTAKNRLNKWSDHAISWSGREQLINILA